MKKVIVCALIAMTGLAAIHYVPDCQAEAAVEDLESGASALMVDNGSGDNFLVNGITKVPIYQDYENPETGEYIHWKREANSRSLKSAKSGVVKEFTFKIRFSITSSAFTVNSSKVKVTTDAWIEDYTGHVSNSNNTGHRYAVSLDGFGGGGVELALGTKQSGKISGLRKGGQYRVTIVNRDALSDSNYLSGSGSIISQ